MKTVVLTGTTSFLGKNVLTALIEQGYKVYAIVRKQTTNMDELPKDENITYIYGDLQHMEAVLDYVQRADCFLHFAWDGSGNAGRSNCEIQQKNVLYSMEILKMAEKLGCNKFVFPGSQAEYGICNERISESSPCNPVSEYGKAKYEFGKMAEEYCQGKGMEFIHLRIFSVYGAGDRSGTLVDSCVRKFNLGEHVELGPCLQMWNYLYITDFVSAILEFLETDCRGGIYNVAGTDTRVLRSFVEDIYDLSNKTGTYSFGADAVNPEGSPSLNPVIDKVIQTLKWEPKVKFTDGIKCIMIDVL